MGDVARPRRVPRVVMGVLVALLVLLAPASAAVASPPLPTMSADTLRTGWYGDESSLAPSAVAAGNFGQLFKAPVTGQVYAQPLVWDGVLLSVTEDNWVYGLDPVTGARKWSRQVGTPFNASDIGCGDLAPHIGITGTPTIDPSTDTAYFAAKSYDSVGQPRWDLHAISIADGSERPNFPVALSGAADNAPGVSFQATTELQRPGLLLMGGRVYVAFGASCDISPWHGWVFGVDGTSGHTTARWVASPAHDGAGIWQAGGGLVSDATGQILLTTGNGGTPTSATSGSSPPSTFGESIVRLQVQSDGTLAPVDFFAPYDAATLDVWDADFGSTGPIALPAPYFGGRNLVVAGGKGGYTFLLDAQHLGGYQQGPGGGDDVLQRLGPDGGVWSHPAAWPGDGGWLYFPSAGATGVGTAGPLKFLSYAPSSSGAAQFSRVAASSDPFGFGSGAPVVSSDGVTNGTALVWIEWASDGSGQNAQLRAYNAVPVSGTAHLVRSFPIGTSSKFAPPGIAGGRVYVGTRDGAVLGFGAPVAAPFTASAVAFPATNDGQTASGQATLTATRQLTITDAHVTSGPFAVSGSASPAQLNAGDTTTIPLTFTPSSAGLAGGTLRVMASDGTTYDLGLSGTGQATGPQLSVSAPSISFGGVAVGAQPTSSAVVLSNVGNSPLTITSVSAPSPPFSTDGPQPQDTIAAGARQTVNVSFAPTSAGNFTDQLAISSNGGNQQIGMSGTAGAPGQLSVTPGTVVDFGDVTLGASATRTFTITNIGGTAVRVTKSKPPALGQFVAAPPDGGTAGDNPLPEGSSLAPGQRVTLAVTFTPTGTGAFSDVWPINSTSATGLQTIQFNGLATASPTVAPLLAAPSLAAPAFSLTAPLQPASLLPAGAAPARASFIATGALSLAATTRVLVRLRCLGSPTAHCHGTVRLWARIGGHTQRIGESAYALAAGRIANVPVRLTPGAVRYLAHRANVRGQLTLMPAGQPPSSLGVRLRGAVLRR